VPVDNPWNLSAKDIEALEALIFWGSNKVAAHKLGMSLKTYEQRLARAKRKAGTHTCGLIALWSAHAARTAA
jgi:FixJ family two-component response regulator